MKVTWKLLAGIAVGTLVLSTPVMAGPGPHGGGEHHHDSGLDLAAGIVRIVGDVLTPRRTVVVAPAPAPVYVAPAPVVAPPPPVVVMPEPVYVAPAPVIVTAPRPVYVQPRPRQGWHGSAPYRYDYGPRHW
ncbi:MAG: hypothetical protein PHI35_02110 [Victivallaceae bacterium]|nr:hypothetical protein [Victivallaceae bacterium]